VMSEHQTGQQYVNILAGPAVFASSSASFELNLCSAATVSYETERNISQGTSERRG